MSPEHLEKISQPFMQADTGTTRKYGGTGLGLAISRNFIEIMGGKLKVESMLDVGSKFSFELTFDTVELDEEDSETSGDGVIEKPQFNGEILVCEDNRMNQQVLCEHLERIGLKTDIAEDGKESVNMVKNRHNKGERPYDLIFMDINMPVMDGIEATARINELNTGTPIIAMTANVMAHDREIYLKSGMQGYIGKPFRVQELWSCLVKYISPEKWDSINEAEQRRHTEEHKLSNMIAFVKGNRDKFGEITDAINTGAVILANRLAHTLKSNAGYLGKEKLQKAAENVERLLRNGKNQVTAEHLSILETELTSVLDEFTKITNNNEQSI
jgi:CheY-like chemotaxis protein